MNYSFPATKWVKTATINRQLKHVGSEIQELVKECIKIDKTGHEGKAIEEAIDLYHSLETLFRILEREGYDIPKAFEMVYLKNAARGYYENPTA